MSNEAKFFKFAAGSGVAVVEQKTLVGSYGATKNLGPTVSLYRGAFGEDGVHFPAVDLFLNQADTRALYEALKAAYEPEGGVQ